MLPSTLATLALLLTPGVVLAQTASDAGQPMDAGAIPDAGNPTDGGLAADAGSVGGGTQVDAGTATDGGLVSGLAPRWLHHDVAGPLPRYGHMMSFDHATGRVLLFGGMTDAGVAQDTWEWDGTSWTELADGGPPARYKGAMALYSGVPLVYGGLDGTGTALQDTWTFDGMTWTSQSYSGGSPGPLCLAAASSNGLDLLLFGGARSSPSSAGTPIGSFAELQSSANSWTNLPTGPSPRYGAGMSYDGNRQRGVLFGGVLGPNDPANGETWEWDPASSSWAFITDGGIPGRAYAVMTYDPRGVTTVFGGLDAVGGRGDTWEWDGTTWIQTDDGGSGQPPARWASAAAYDPVRARIVLFGGLTATGLLGDTWEYGVMLPDGGVVDAGTPSPSDGGSPPIPQLKGSVGGWACTAGGGNAWAAAMLLVLAWILRRPRQNSRR